MKQILLTGILALGLVACGSTGTTDTGTTPTTPTTPTEPTTPTTPTTPAVDPSLANAFNPDASATELADKTVVPYKGDWAWVAKVGTTYYQGVLKVDSRGAEAANAKNGGQGQGALCSDANCATTVDPSYGAILTQITAGKANLAAFFGKADKSGQRLGVTDSDGKVTLNSNGRYVISGTGWWERLAQTAQVAFVQIDVTRGTDYATLVPTVLAQAKAAADAVSTQSVVAPATLSPDYFQK